MDEQTTQAPEQPQAEATTPVEPDNNGEAQSQVDGANKSDEEQDSPDPRVTRANKEAAKYRTQLRDVEKQNQELSSKLDTLLAGLAELTGGTPKQSPEEQLESVQAELAAAKQQLKESTISQAVQVAAAKKGIDTSLAVPLLKGTGALSNLDPDKESFVSDLDAVMEAVTDQFPQLKPVAKTSGQPAKNTEPEHKDYVSLQHIADLNAQGKYAEANKLIAEGRVKTN